MTNPTPPDAPEQSRDGLLDLKVADAPPLVVHKDFRVIFQINWDGTVEGAVEDAGEAARIFAREAAMMMLPYRAALSRPSLEPSDANPIASAPKTPDDFSVTHSILGWCPDADAPDGGDWRVVWWEPKMNGGCWYGDRDLVEHPTVWFPLPNPIAALQHGEG